MPGLTRTRCASSPITALRSFTRKVSATAPEEVYALAKRVDRPEAEAILLSCTDLATLDVIERLETETGKPVVSSNTATFWFALRRAGIDDRLDGFGRLLKEH